jgi:rhodanese-related sulfurtransferase
MRNTLTVSMSFLLLITTLWSSVVTAKDDYLVESSPESVAGATLVDDAKARELFDQGVLFVDVRSQQAYDKGRIPDSLLLDLKKGFSREALAAEATPEQPVVIYCQGIKCSRAAVAAERALEWGYKEVYYYRSGFPGWKEAGYPIE